MHRKLNRSYFQIFAVFMTAILMFGTLSTGWAHMRCLIEDHQMCDMHAGDVGDTSHNLQTGGSASESDDCCQASDATDSKGELQSHHSHSTNMECQCTIQAEVKTQRSVKPTKSNALAGKTVLQLDSIINGSFFKSSKPFLFNNDRHAADFPTQAVYLVNASFLI